MAAVAKLLEAHFAQQPKEQMGATWKLKNCQNLFCASVAQMVSNHAPQPESSVWYIRSHMPSSKDLDYMIELEKAQHGQAGLHQQDAQPAD